MKYEQVDFEVYSPRRKTYIESGSCSNLTTAQARKLGILNKDKRRAHRSTHIELIQLRQHLYFNRDSREQSTKRRKCKNTRSSLEVHEWEESS